MNDKYYFNELLDFYQLLLTTRQREIMDDYYRQDLSLSEIAENLQISKAGVSDTIRKAEKTLIAYEEKLKLLSKHKKRMALCQDNTELRQLLQDIEEEE